MALLARSPTMPSTSTAPPESISSVKAPAGPIDSSTWSDRSFFYDSPSSPKSFPSVSNRTSSASVDPNDSLAPPGPRSPYPSIIDPSPVDSNGTVGTDSTEIDDETQDDARHSHRLSQERELFDDTIVSPQSPFASPLSPLAKIDTSVDPAANEKDEPESGSRTVVSAPRDYNKLFDSASPATARGEGTAQSPTSRSENTVVSPSSPERQLQGFDRRESYTSPIRTDVPPAKDRPTPRAQTRQELEEEWLRRKMRNSSLEGIPEGQDGDEFPQEDAEGRDAQAAALKSTLEECWSMCNRFARLSSNHRTRLFSFGGKADVSETAWRSCWKLCQNLYESRDQDPSKFVMPTLRLCREFCQALFDARRKDNEGSDSVLRVSFELNNHLYNTQDKNLHPAFSERTLEFYVTLCHRLVRQPNSLPSETDALLRACWELAEILINIRDSNREGKTADDELFHSAIDACWDLCDLFRDGWSRDRPERGTPKAHQTTFSNRSSPSLSQSSAGHSYRQDSARSIPPETPTTIFDDMQDPMDDLDEENVPNILVLGPERSPTNSIDRSNRWPSSASSVSAYSSASQTTATSTAGPPSTINHEATVAVEKNLDCIRILIVKAAMDAGFSIAPRSTSPPLSTSPSARSREQTAALSAFAKAMQLDAFGQQAWQRQLVAPYRKMVQAWPLQTPGPNNSQKRAESALIPPNGPRKASVHDIAKAVRWMMRADQWRWLGDLFRHTFGAFTDEAMGRQDVVSVG